jgi:hypothetical protein
MYEILGKREAPDKYIAEAEEPPHPASRTNCNSGNNGYHVNEKEKSYALGAQV